MWCVSIIWMHVLIAAYFTVLAETVVFLYKILPSGTLKETLLENFS